MNYLQGAYIQEGTRSSPWLFSGQRYDTLIGLYHFDKREYDPHAGRWLTPDPLGFSEGPNLFTYVKNNPLIYVDPYGLWWAETKDFVFGTSRGFVDDASWNTSHHALGTYRPTSTAGTWGYHLGTWASMAVGLCIGSTEVRAANVAYSSIKKLPSALNSSTKSLRETFNFTKSTANNTPIKQVFEKVTAQKNTAVINKEVLDLDKLSQAGQILDRGGLTKAGRALEKHGGRPNNAFPKATGNLANKNIQGQFHLDDIITHPKSRSFKDGTKGIEIYAPDGRGAYFREDGSFRGFVEENFR